jgi:hypothetical protein
MPKPDDPNLLNAVIQLMLYMPPQLLGEPLIYFAVILAFIFVLVTFTSLTSRVTFWGVDKG